MRVGSVSAQFLFLEMKKEQRTQYQRRLDPETSDVLRVRLERPLADTIQALQEHPTCAIKGNLIPSRSLIMRRAIQVYDKYVRGLRGDAADRENAELHRLT
ncbi:hypothetical protein [Pandoraea sp. B-6]|uniref:hypothetical protein n=1 Tax=Pandoraea sp. B-6 TaxID=1204340 RepID=UPI00037FADAB|nr:hypothetical protein [Pandoraea sp. B-6]